MSATKNDVVKVLMTMGVLYDKAMNEDAGEMFLSDLEGISYDSILIALKKCRSELTRFPTIAEIVSRVQSNDGRIGTEEAWSMLPKDERTSIVWTEEMRIAFGVAYPLLDEDRIAARMAFKEKYESLVKDARSKNIPVKWSASYGSDVQGREAAIKEAIDKNRISQSSAQKMLPEVFQSEQLLLGSPEDAAEIRKMIEGAFK